MIKRRELLSLAAKGLVLAALLALCLWLTSFDFGDFRPESPAATFVLWALSTGVVLGTIALGFLLFRNLVKLYVEHRANKLGSRIKTKLVFGVLALSIAPIALHVWFSITLLNRNLDKWFSQPTVEVLRSAERLVDGANQEALRDLGSAAERIAASPRFAAAVTAEDPTALRNALDDAGAGFLAVVPSERSEGRREIAAERSAVPQALGSIDRAALMERPRGVLSDWLYSSAALPSGNGHVVLGRRITEAMSRERAFMQAQVREWQELEAARPIAWRESAYQLALITIFMLFIAVWLAQFVSKQITRPIEALVTATGELAGGHLEYRVKTAATDELAGLVASFNSMSQALESKTRQIEENNRDLARANTEIEERRRFIDAILQSITPGVVSVDGRGEILKFNESARRMAAPRQIASLHSVTDLLEGADKSAFEHMFSSAQRTGIATRDFEIDRKGRPLHLSVTVSSLDSEDSRHGFVVVLEDTTEILRAQRSEAWQEVARRLAHEIKNPLTPVALAAGRIDRLIERFEDSSEPRERARIRDRLAQSTRTIDREVQSLKSLVDSFSDLARFPAVRPEDTDVNVLVEDAVGVFEGRLADVKITLNKDPDVPRGKVDPEPFKRAIINLIDNAAEVVQNCWVKEIAVSIRGTRDRSGVEVIVADSGPGISPENKEKLFLPYFSTKDRGTGLGLSIVRSIVHGHGGTIRVEDNEPTGSRFIVEVPAAASESAELQEATA